MIWLLLYKVLTFSIRLFNIVLIGIGRLGTALCAPISEMGQIFKDLPRFVIWALEIPLVGSILQFILKKFGLLTKLLGWANKDKMVQPEAILIREFTSQEGDLGNSINYYNLGLFILVRIGALIALKFIWARDDRTISDLSDSVVSLGRSTINNFHRRLLNVIGMDIDDLTQLSESIRSSESEDSEIFPYDGPGPPLGAPYQGAIDTLTLTGEFIFQHFIGYL